MDFINSPLEPWGNSMVIDHLQEVKGSKIHPSKKLFQQQCRGDTTRKTRKIIRG